MGRTKQFDRTAVLEKAMELFWHQGFDATSMQDLVKHMGINRASLYATFENKQKLFQEALARYLAVVVTRRLAVVTVPGASLAAIRQFFQEVIDFAVGDTQRRG